MPGQPASSTKGLVATAEVLINGSPLAAEIMDDLIDVRVEQSIRVPSRTIVRFEDHDFKLLDGTTFAIGSEMIVKLGDANGVLTPVFTGEITSIGVEQSMTMGHELVIEAFDLSHRLGGEGSPQTYLKMSYGDVVRRIAGENGLSAQVDSALDGVHEYLLRVGSISSFLDQIAVRTGTEWLIDGRKLTFRRRANKSPEKTLTFGVDLRRFKARFTDAGRVKNVEVRSWDPLTKREIVGSSAVTANGRDGSNAADGVQRMRTDAASKSGKLINGSLAAQTSAEATNLARALADRRITTDLTARGEVVGDPSLKAGVFVKVEGCGTRMGGKYYLTSVEHNFGRREGLVTKFTAGPIENSSIVDMLGGGSSGGAWGGTGLVVGVVTNNNDPDKLHRVKVKFPSLSNQDESAWARVVTLGAGNGRGFHMLPYVDDEVLVGFEHGDLRRPYVLGSMWNGKDKPPVPEISKMLNGGKVVQSGIRTGAGHSMLFRDGPDDQNVEVKLKDDKTKLLLDEKKVELHANGQTLELKCGQASIKLESNGNITITGQALKLDAKTTLDANSQSGLNLKTTGSLKIEAMAIQIKANATIQGEAGATLILKGNPALIN